MLGSNLAVDTKNNSAHLVIYMCIGFLLIFVDGADGYIGDTNALLG